MSSKFRDTVCAIFFLLTFSPVIDAAQDGLLKCGDSSKQQTLFIMCQDEAKHVLSPISLSEGNMWRAYVEVDIQSNCLHTTRLWIAQEPGAYRLVYLMPPKRTDSANGMEILGWAEDSGMLLVRTAEWQYGSDAQPQESVLAIDAGTGMVYEADLGAMMPKRKDKQCRFCVVDAGFAEDTNTIILVRAKFQTWLDVDETYEDVPQEQRCENSEETWSFSYATGEIKREPDAKPLKLFKEFLPQRKMAP